MLIGWIVVVDPVVVKLSLATEGTNKPVKQLVGDGVGAGGMAGLQPAAGGCRQAFAQVAA